MASIDKMPWIERLFRLFDSVSVSGMKSLRVTPENATQFGEFLTASRTPIIELNSSYGFSLLRDQQEVIGSGSIIDGDGTIDVSTGATASSQARLESAEIGRYIPGYGAEIGVGVLLESLPVGEQVAIWGGIGNENNNGVYFGVDVDGYFVAVRKGGVETKVYQSEWNQDKLDGTGASGYTLDARNGVIFQIQFTWYGYGQIKFGVIGIDETEPFYKQQHFIDCHSIKMIGEPSLETPNLRVFAQTENGATAADFVARIGGRQYSIIGEYIPKYRFVGEFRGTTSTSTTVIPLITFRRKTGFGDRSIKVEGFDALVGSAPAYIEVRLNGSLTGASFVTPRDHTAAETAVEADRSATAITGGVVIWTQLLGAGANLQQGQLASQSVDFDIPNGQNVTLCVRTTSGTGDIVSAFRLREEW